MQKIFFVFILIYYCQTLADINRENPTSIRRGSLRVKIKRDNEQKSPKINGILFLADTYPDEEYTNTSGINLLHLEHKVDVKHCTIDNRKCTQTKDSKCHKLPCTCYERLKEAIIGLINYSQTYLDMITALGSISNHSFSNSLRFGSAEIDLNIKTLENFKEPNSYQTKDGCPENKVKNELYQNEVEKTTVNYNRVPLLNVFPKDTPPLDSNMEDDSDKSLYLRGKRKEDGPYIFGSEHTEVFKIRSRRDEIGEPREITDADYLNRKQKPTTIFDLLDILSVIHKSLLGEESDFNPHYDDEFPPIHMNYLRKVKTPGLFEVVQKTLYSILENTSSGFLLIIIGGNMSDIASPYSSLVQSIKHVIENTDENNTLIVLTGTCPNRPEISAHIPCNEMTKHTMPVFALGPSSDDLSQCNELYDVPIMVKNILRKRYFMSKQGSYGALPLIKPKKKRGIKYDNCRDEEPSWEKTLQKYSHDKSSKMAKSFALVLVETILVVSFGIAVI